MTGAVKYAIAVGVAVAAGVGVAVAVKSSSSSSPATPNSGVPPQGSTVWVRASVLNPGQNVRISVSQAALAAMAQTMTGITVDLPGFESLLASPVLFQVLGTTSFQAWGPGQALPADWPPDDTGAATEFHAQFVYGGTTALLISSIPLTVSAWVPKGTGA